MVAIFFANIFKVQVVNAHACPQFLAMMKRQNKFILKTKSSSAENRTLDSGGKK